MHSPPSLSDASFDIWRVKGIVTLKDLYINKQFATFTLLKISSLFLIRISSDTYKLGIMFDSVSLTLSFSLKKDQF